MTNKLLAPPQYCDACSSTNISFTLNDAIYGKAVGDWPYIWYCCDCRAAVGCHANTNTPLGFMAGSAVRKLRATAHGAFDPMWKTGLLPRDAAYQWMARLLDIPYIDAHISQLSADNLRKLIPAANQYCLMNSRKAEKRKIRRHVSRERAITREQTAINLRRNGPRRP